MKQFHTIGKLLLELQLPTAEGSFLLQEKLSRTCAAELPGLLDEVLQDWVGPGELLRIDRLEIDLGTVSPGALEKTLVQLILKHLRGHSPALMGAVDERIKLQYLPAAYGHFESWLYFLQHGLLPHLASVSDRKEWEKSVLETLATEAFAVQKCKQVLETNKEAVNRLVLQFSPTFFQKWIAAFSGDRYSRQLQLITECMACCLDLHRSRTNASFLSLAQPSASNVQQTCNQWLISQIVSEKLPHEMGHLLEELFYLFVEKAAFGTWIRAIEEHLATTKNQWKELEQAVLHLKKGHGAEKVNKKEGRQDQALSRHQSTYDTSESETAAEVEQKRQSDLLQDKECVDSRIDDDTKTASAGSQPAKPENILDEKALTTAKTSQDKNEREVEQSSPVAAEQTLTPEQKKEGQMLNQKQDDQNVVQDTAMDSFSAAKNKGQVETHTNKDEDRRENSNASSRDKVLAKPAFCKEEPEGDRIEQEVKKGADSNPPAPPEGLVTYIGNAGLVLLHPYLFVCFDALGLLENRGFKNDESQHKAVQVLGYLATGQTGLPEYEVVLPKLLCGLLPEQPVNRFVAVSNDEKAEADELLKAVIENWGALGNTSPDGLRANFLLREGKLQWIQDEWRLRVTQQSYDVLLDKLPWGLGIVKLPWMPWFLKTEWV